MSRVVLDANVISSGILGLDRDTSTPGALLRYWHNGAYELLTSDTLIAEVERTLRNRFFAPRVGARLIEIAVASLQQDATKVPITITVSGVASHPEDDLVLATAVSANADYLVTGDKPLQKLQRYGAVTILSPRDFLTLLEESGQPATPNDE